MRGGNPKRITSVAVTLRGRADCDDPSGWDTSATEDGAAPRGWIVPISDSREDFCGSCQPQDAC